jgi:hypothetical protein
VEEFFTRAQQARSAAGLARDFRLAVDDHWWLANAVLLLADRANTRYGELLRGFTDAWMLAPPAAGAPPTGVADVSDLAYEVRALPELRGGCWSAVYKTRVLTHLVRTAVPVLR